MKALILVVWILNLTCCYGGQGSTACFEAVHIALVIWNMVSDILVLLELYAKQDNYDTFIDEISDSSSGYSLSFCYPTLFPVEWFQASELPSLGCFCEEIDLHCVNNSITLDTSNVTNGGSINYTTDVLNDTYHFVADAVNDETTCSSNIWAISDSFRQYFSINNWQCQYCNCSNSNYAIYDKNYSLAIRKLEYEYIMMKSEIDTTYCNPHKMLKLNKKTWNLDDLLVAAWIFVIIGIIASLSGSGIRCLRIHDDWELLELHGVYVDQDLPEFFSLRRGQTNKQEMEESNKEIEEINKLEKKNSQLQKDVEKQVEKDKAILNRYHAAFRIAKAKSVAQIIVTLLQDIPHTIIALYLLVFLYSDDGYYCVKSFVDDADDDIAIGTGFALTKTVIDESDSVLVALARNWQILFSFAASICIIFFNALFSAYTFSIEMDHKDRHDGIKKNRNERLISFCKSFMVYGTACVVTIMLWTPTMGVLYFYVAPAFDKSWTMALVMFIIGCTCWGIVFIMMICFGCMQVRGSKRRHHPTFNYSYYGRGYYRSDLDDWEGGH